MTDLWIPPNMEALVSAFLRDQPEMTDLVADRVYTAIGTLRRLGLGRVLVRRDGGYALDPALPTVII